MRRHGMRHSGIYRVWEKRHNSDFKPAELNGLEIKILCILSIPVNV